MKTPVTLLALLAWMPFAFAETMHIPGLQSIDATRYHVIESRPLDRGFHLFVGLPDDYDGDGQKTYPVVYLLDGGELYPLLRSYYRYLRLGEEIPPLILVAISYGTADWRDGNYRSHDYTAPSEEREFWGGAPAFREFLRNELVPFVEDTYRADPGQRVIFGQSLGGQFVLYAAQTDPDLFRGYIASNPALHRNLGFFLETAPARGSASRLYVASASADDPGFRGPALAWMRHWTSRPETPWTLETQTLEGHNHFSAPPAAFRNGLVWVFSDADETGSAR